MAGAASVALATSGIVLAASTSVAIVHETVDAGWRGTYDLLVRPDDAPFLTVGGDDLVPLDYLGLQTSGITREQWQRVAQLSGVEVAAPVAALGWLKNSTHGITIVLQDHQPGVVYGIEARATISGQDAVRRTGLIAFRDDRVEVDVGFPDYAGPHPVYVSFRDLPATWGLVVGIDPTSENALIGLAEFVDGQYLSTGTSQVYDPGFNRTAVAVPVLTAARSPIPGELTVTVSTVEGVSLDQVEALYKASGTLTRDDLEGAIERLIGLGSAIRISGDSAAFNDLFRPLRWGGITLGPDGQLRFSEGESGGGGLLTDDNVLLVPSLSAYSPTGTPGADLKLPNLGSWQAVVDPELAAARPLGWWPPEATFGGDSTVYRDLQVAVPPAFMLTPIGTYDRDAIDERFALAANYAPLGIYAAIPRTIVEDAEGVPTEEPLPVSINPAGLNPQPPVGLTNLEAVEALRGERFIDAIRVRVTDVTSYTPDAVRRIETVAKQIVETTGLHVDVIAGSSPVDVRVSVPGTGIMRERWTTLGTAAAIVSGAEGLSAGLLGAALVVIIAYLAAFGVFLTGDQMAEIDILRRVGWRRRHVVGVVATQAIALGALAATLTVGLIAVLAAAGGQRIDGSILASAALLVLVAHPSAAGLAGLLGLRGERVARARGPRTYRTSGGTVGLAFAFVAEAPGRAIVAGLATTIALAVAGLIAAVELAAGGELRTTLFGAVVALHLASYHFLAAAAAVFAAGALILDGAILTVERRLSVIGTLRAVGWRSRPIRLLVTLETASPAIVAGLVASTVVGAVAVAVGIAWASVPLVLGVLILGGLLAVIATQLPAGLAVRTVPGATLRAEGASAIVGGFAPRQAFLTVGAMVATIALVAGGWGAAESAAGKPLPFVQPTEHPLSAVALRIQSDVAAIAEFPDRVPGSTSFEHGLSYIADALRSDGYDVQQGAYLSPKPGYFDDQGKPVAIAQGPSTAIAYNAGLWDGETVDLQSVFFDASDGRIPPSCSPGAVVLRIVANDQVRLAQELLGRCLHGTSVVLAVRAIDDSTWATLVERAVKVHLPVAHYLTAASPRAAVVSDAPWLVAVLDSLGPGASQSAAPGAVLLAAARQAATEELAVRIGVAAVSDEAAGSVLVRRMVEEGGGPVVWLGPMGGPVAPVLGTAALDGLDKEAATAGLMWIAQVDGAFSDWLALASAPSDFPTSVAVLGILSESLGLVAGDEASVNTGALTAGLDAAWFGEPSVVTVGPSSVAGTSADTFDQVHPGDLEQFAHGLVRAVREFGHMELEG